MVRVTLQVFAFKVVTLLVSVLLVVTLFTSISIKNQLNLLKVEKKIDGDDDSKTDIGYDTK